ncbi:hypothetical protein HWQ46_02420 [Shewanella sp. D64]|uniref:hypothetical protein n=1 Tax=unclassified Shewanella TaxID=196818 RepID=UPI002DD64702|nr:MULTISPECIES: hypothetical protein [unclassified Shewanella]MEC4724400.1 hypothetical protein [Shewanella sp. D64]MEC4736823.1 hypothetical protein [Shewanella sp. E94]
MCLESALGLLHSVLLPDLDTRLNLAIRSDEGSRRVGNCPHTDEATLDNDNYLVMSLSLNTLSGANSDWRGLLLDEPLERS